MTKWSEIPGVVGGMFFEYYVFEPQTNFHEEDIVHIARFIDILYHEETPIPEGCERHFNEDKEFKPQDDLTLGEFTDILNGMKIQAQPEFLSKMPKGLQDHFDETGTFTPYTDFSFDDLKEFLVKFVRLRINAEQHNSLPERRLKRQFIVYTRDGKTWRWGARVPG